MTGYRRSPLEELAVKLEERERELRDLRAYLIDERAARREAEGRRRRLLKYSDFFFLAFAFLAGRYLAELLGARATRPW